jgi:hypothetical protein
MSPAYIVEPTTSQGPVTGQANQTLVTIPCIVPGVPFYSFGRIAGYNDAPTQNTEFGEAFVVGKGRQVAIRNFVGLNQNSPAVGIQVLTPSAPASFSITIEGSFTDIDGEYYALPAEAPDFTPNPIVAVGSSTFPLGHQRLNFIRANCTAFSGGTNPTVVVKFTF